MCEFLQCKLQCDSMSDPETNNKTEQPNQNPEPVGFWTLVKEDYLVNGCDWTRPGFRAVFMYRFGVRRMQVRLWLFRVPLSVIYRWMHRYVRNRYGIELHYTTKIGRRLRIAHQGAIVIHEHATIGDDCTLRQGVTIGASNKYSIEEAPRLGNGIDVGAGAMIVGNVSIGDRARIGPNAVVMMNVPADSTAFAPPARIVQAPRVSTESAAAIS
jgi:serine O-acetyltransferase